MEVAPEPEPASEPEWAPTRRVRVTARDYRWHLRYPGPDGELDTDDDVVTLRHLHLPREATVELELTSADYVYTFYVPDLDVLEAAAPDDAFFLDLDTGPEAVYDLLGSQMCGYAHDELLGDVVVESEADLRAWLESSRP